MKALILIIVAVLLCQFIFAQITSGSGGQTNERPTVSNSGNDNIFDNAFYLRVGSTKPLGPFGETPDNLGHFYDSYSGEKGFGAKRGIMAEMGTIFYLDLPLPEKIKFGIDATFLDFSFNGVDWKDPDVSISSFLFAGVKVGPAFSVNPIGKIVLDGYFKIAPTMVRVGYADYYSDNWSCYIEDTYHSVIHKSIGLNFRYQALILGWELNWGEIKGDYTYYEYNYNTSNSISKLIEGNIATKTQRFTLGLKF
jgi:hypothetical protein